jgi:hypothetical protein
MPRVKTLGFFWVSAFGSSSGGAIKPGTALPGFAMCGVCESVSELARQIHRPFLL